MNSLVYDPEKVGDPEALAALLGIGQLIAGVPPSMPSLTLPASGWAVVRQTWKGLDVLAGPTTKAAIDALPDPGPDPAEAAALDQRARLTALVGDAPPNLTLLEADLATLRQAAQFNLVPHTADLAGLTAFLALPAPTNAQTLAAVQALGRLAVSTPTADQLAAITQAVIRVERALAWLALRPR